MHGSSGFAATSTDERLLITSNLKDAVDTYSIPPSQHVRSLCHPIHRNVPLAVCSALDGALTLSGSDDGSPRVFDQRVGTLAQLLPHGNGECFCLFSNVMGAYHAVVGSLVQAVAVRLFILSPLSNVLIFTRLTLQIGIVCWLQDHPTSIRQSKSRSGWSSQ